MGRELNLVILMVYSISSWMTNFILLAHIPILSSGETNFSQSLIRKVTKYAMYKFDMDNNDII